MQLIVQVAVATGDDNSRELINTNNWTATKVLVGCEKSPRAEKF